jgi:two-component system, OmpR family, sensor kinase
MNPAFRLLVGGDANGTAGRALWQRLEPMPNHPELMRHKDRVFRQMAAPLGNGGLIVCLDEVGRGEEAREQRAGFLSVVSHDVRGILANVRSYASILTSGKVHLDERALRGAQVILRNADRALLLLQECFDLFRFENGTLPMDAIDQPVAPLLTEAAKKVQPMAQERHVTVHLSVSPELGNARVDRSRVLHVAQVFLEHALSRVEAGQSIGLEARPEGTSLRTEIWDQGPPIPEAALGSVFDPEARTVQERKLGAGFRLAVAAAEVRAHGGSVFARSGADAGTVLCFLLPR